MVVEVREECLLPSLDCTVAGILHVTADDDSGLPFVAHALKGIQSNLRIQAGYAHTVVLLGFGTSEWRIGDYCIVGSLKGQRTILRCHLAESLLTQVGKARLVQFIGVYAVGRNGEHQHSVSGGRFKHGAGAAWMEGEHVSDKGHRQRR